MAATNSDFITQGEVQSPLRSSQQEPKNEACESLGRQSTIYSLTLDEFQNTLSDSGKNFGSMNMDEFLNSIWTAEENQAQASTTTETGNRTSAAHLPHQNGDTMEKKILKQPTLTRQGSLSVPEPLCRKTVDQVWSEIHRSNDSHSHTQDPSTAQRQVTFGEMTLEDFLVKAGVVRAQNPAPAPPQQPPPAYPLSAGVNFGARPIMAVPGGAPACVNVVNYQAFTQSCATMGNGSGGFGQMQGLGMGSSASPVSSGGPCGNRAESGNLFGLDMGGPRGGRKRIIDGPVEKVVERRQRRMIKNRESAARSRARKQAYTVELEAELNQLKEENEHLKQALAEFERKRRQQVLRHPELSAMRKPEEKHRRSSPELRKQTRN